MNWFIKSSYTNKKSVSLDLEAKYPICSPGSVLDGLIISQKDVPNTASISSSFEDYSILRGIRRIPMAEFTSNPREVFYAANDFEWSRKLAEQIKLSQEIVPLIVAIEDEGPYILEGVHRFVALLFLQKQFFPAIVVVDETEYAAVTDAASHTSHSGM